MADFELGRKAIAVDRVPVVLGGDVNEAGLDIANRMVAAAMTELEFVRVAAERAGEDLVAEADAHNRHVADETFGCFDEVVEQLGVARARRHQDAIGLPVEQLSSGHSGRVGHDVATASFEQPQDVVLEPEVADQDAVPFTADSGAWDGLVPGVRRRGRHTAYEVGGCIRRQFLQPRERLLGALLDGDDPHHDAPRPDAPRYRPRVDAADTDDALGRQELVQRHVAVRVAGRVAMIADHESRNPNAPRFEVMPVDPIVADERVRRDDDLSRVRRVRQDLLVSGHGRVEHDLAIGRGLCVAEGISGVYGAVF